MSDGVSVEFDDYGIDLNVPLYGAVGVTWAANIIAGAATLNYTTTVTGTNAILTYIETKW